MSESIEKITNSPRPLSQPETSSPGGDKFSLLHLFSRRWIFSTILVVVGMITKMGYSGVLDTELAEITSGPLTQYEDLPHLHGVKHVRRISS